MSTCLGVSSTRNRYVARLRNHPRDSSYLSPQIERPCLISPVVNDALRNQGLVYRGPSPTDLLPPERIHVGVLSILHPDKEIATAKAAAATNTPMVLSNAASSTMEHVAEALGPDTPGWFQL